MSTVSMSATVTLGGKRFVIVEEKRYRKLVDQVEKIERMTRQDWGDVAESKRRLADAGASISWERIKARRLGKAVNSTNGKRGR